MSQDARFLRPTRGPVRSARRRRARFLLGLAVVLTLVAAAAILTSVTYSFLTHPEQFRVSNIFIDGLRFAERDAIEEAVRGLCDANMLLVDLDQVCRAAEQHSWVLRAQARKVLPDTLQLTVQERTPTVFVSVGGQTFLSDESGELIDRLRPEHPFSGLPVVSGVDALSEAGRRARIASVARQLAALRSRPLFLERIEVVNAGAADRLELSLADGAAPVIVADGRIVEGLAKYLAIEAELRKRYDRIEYVDARFERRLYVKPAGGELSAQP